MLAGLRDAEARQLLDAALAGPIDAQVRDQIIAEAHGNPLALLELPRGLTPAQLAGGFGFPGAAGLPGSMEESFWRGRRIARWRRLPTTRLTRTAGLGTGRKLPPGLMTMLRPNLSVRPVARRLAEASALRLPSSSALRSSRSSPHSAPGERWPRHTPSSGPASSTRHARCCR
jgi:hypothetical protein